MVVLTRHIDSLDGTMGNPLSSQLSAFLLFECGLLEGQSDWRVVGILKIGPLDHDH